MTSTSKESASPQVFNIPNQLTAARLVLAIAVFALIPLQLYAWAAGIFMIAAATDWMDGYWARKYGQVTQLGRIFDPFVDKIIICGTFIMLAIEMAIVGEKLPWFSAIAGWMAVVVVGREILVTALRGFIEQHGGDFSANMAGKLKMVFQCAAVVASLISLKVLATTGAIPDWLIWLTAGCNWLAVASTIYSGVGYVFAAAKQIKP